MTPALLLNESSSPLATADSTALPSPNGEPPAVMDPILAIRSRINRRNPLLRRNVRTPSLWLTGAEGNWLSVTDGAKEWKVFDASGGASVSNIGYKDHRVFAAMNEQQETGVSYAASMDFVTDVVWDCADALLDSTNNEMSEVVFFSSGNGFLQLCSSL
jgi:4-aminobutyrate aminotransferase-like enzyme